MELFQPDNFSKAKIQFNKCGDNTKHFLKILERYFDNPEIVGVYQVDRAEIQTQNYKIIVRDFEETKTILLKKYIVSADNKQTEFYLNFLVLLQKKSVAVSTVLKTLQGESTATIDGKMYSLFEFMAGDHFFPLEQGLANVAMSMAKMHVAFNEFDNEYVNQIDTLSQMGYYPFNVIKKYTEQDLSVYEEKIKNKDKKEKIEKNVLTKLPLFKEAAREIEKNKERIARLPAKIIHSDFHPHNVLMDNNKVKAIIDFENVRIGQQARDIAFAIYKFGRQFFTGSMSVEEVKLKANRLQDLFITHYDKIRPLSNEEVELLLILAKDTFIRKLLFVLKGVYDEGNYLWINDLPKHIVAIDEINYFWPHNHG